MAVIALSDDQLTGLAGLILSPKANIQQNALTLLTALFDCNETSKDLFRESGGIPSLLSVASSRNGRHLLALQALAKLCSNNVKNCNTVREIGGVSILVDLITANPMSPAEIADNPTVANEHMESQLYAVLALGSLSSSSVVVADISHTEGGSGVRALVSLMSQSQDDSVKEAAVLALSKLVNNEECAHAVFALGGVNHAAQMLNSPRSSLQIQALKLLEKLSSQSEAVQLAIGETTAIPSMVSILISFSHQNNRSNQASINKIVDAELVRSAVFALADACKDCAVNREKAFGAGCIAPLLSVIPPFAKDPLVQLRAVHLISAFASDPRCCNAIKDERGMHALVELLFTYNATANSSSDDRKDSTGLSLDVQIQANAAVALAHLAHQANPHILAELLACGAVLALAPLLAQPNPSLQEYAALSLGNIAQVSEEARVAVVSAGVVPSAIAMLSTDATSTIAQGLYLLTCLSTDPELPGLFLNHQGVPPCTNIILKSSPQLRQAAIGFLTQVSQGTRSGDGAAIWQEFIQVGGVQGLLMFLESDIPAAQWKASQALASGIVQGGQEAQSQIITAGGVKPLITLLNSHEPSVTAQALLALSRLTAKKECAGEVVEGGGISAIVKIMGQPASTEVNLAGIEILSHIAQHAEFRPLLCTNGALPRITDALFAQNTSQQSLAAKAIAMLTEDAANAQLVFEAGGLLALVPLLSPSQQGFTRVTAALAITNLARFYPPSRAAILHSEDGSGLGLILAILMAPSNVSSDENNNGNDNTLAVRSLILELLQMLSEETGFAELLESIGGVPGVVSQFNDAASQQKKNLSHILCLLHVFANVSRHGQARNSLLKTDLLPSLVKILTPNKELLVPLDALAALEGQTAQEEQNRKLKQIEYKTVDIIANLSINDEMRMSVGKSEGMIKQLVEFVVRAGTASEDWMLHIGGVSARAIALLAFNESNRDTIRDAGGVEAIAHLLRTPTILASSPSKGKDKDSVEACTTMMICNAAWALEVLCFNAKNREIMISNGGIPALISLLSCPEEEIQAISVRALRTLSTYPVIAQLFVVSNLGGKYLLDILYSCKNDYVLAHTLELIQNLLMFDATRNMLSQTITRPTLEKLKTQLWSKNILQPLLVALEMFLSN